MKQYEPESSTSKALARALLMIGGIIIMLYGVISMALTGDTLSGFMWIFLGMIMTTVGGWGMKVKKSKNEVIDTQANVLDGNKKSQELCIFCKSKEQYKCYMCQECYTKAQDDKT